jgi:hypothetical protein
MSTNEVLTMSEFGNYIGIWDLDRPDSLLHMRNVVADLSNSVARAKRMGKRDRGRFVLLMRSEFMRPTEMIECSVRDAAHLRKTMRDTFAASKAKTRISLFHMGLLDSVEIIRAIVNAHNAFKRDSIRLDIQPQLTD